MTLDLDKLERLAREATPGPWKLSENHPRIVYATDAHFPNTGETIIDGRSDDYGQYDCMDDLDDAAFIAAANPVTVLALIARVRAARAALLRVWPDGAACQHADARAAFQALER